MAVFNVDQLLRDFELFRHMEREEVAALGRSLQRRTVPTGTLLMSIEQAGAALYIILEGSVKVFLNREDGSEVIVALLGAGQTLGEMGVFLEGLRSANALTMERTTVLAMSGPEFQACLEAMPRLSINLNRLLSQRLRLANQQILSLSSLDVAGRVARELLAFAEQFGKGEERGRVRIPLRLTQSDIASIIGTSRERVNQVMVRWKRRGYLSVDRSHHITVHDREALARRCGWALA
jgi:CRP/FNR family cyclic AMP-dependent transcriptional regulator